MEPEFRVSIMIIGDCSPEEITRVTGIKPTAAWHKGEQVPGTILVKKNNGWQFDSPLPPQRPLTDHVNQLLAIVEPAQLELKECTKQCLPLLACAVYFDHAPDIYLDATTMARLGALNLGLDIDLYCSD